MRRAIALALLATFALPIAACGGDDSTETVTVGESTIAVTAADDVLTKAEYVARADAICQGNAQQSSELTDQYKKAADDSDYDLAATLLGQNVDLEEAAAEDLRALTPPTDDERIIEQWLDAVEQRTALLASVIEALEARQTGKLGPLFKREKELQAEAASIATGYGLKVCNGEG